MNGQIIIRGSDHFAIYGDFRLVEGNTGETWKVLELNYLRVRILLVIQIGVSGGSNSPIMGRSNLDNHESSLF